MSSMLQLCYKHPSLADQLRELDAQIDAVEKPFLAALNKATAPETKDLAAAVMKAVGDHDQLFGYLGSTGSGDVSGSTSSSGQLSGNTEVARVTGYNVANLDAAYVNAGLKKIERSENDAKRDLASSGFVPVNGRLYSTGSTPSRPTTVDVQDPESAGYLKTVLRDPTYKDPEIITPVARVNAAAPSGRSCTGAYITPGTVADVRELYKGFGGDLGSMRRFLEQVDAGSGVGVVWSMLHYATAYSTTGAALKYDDVRDQVKAPLYDEDINIDGLSAVASVEYHVGTQMPKSTALAQAKFLCRQIGISEDPVLMCRFVHMDQTPTVRSQAPVVSTIGFDARKLGRKSYRLGVSVCGYARIIDVTGDRGTRTLIAEYTNRTVAATIARVFGDIVSVVGVGNEIAFAVNQRGQTARISFFHVDDYDASEACGIDGLVRDQARRNGDDKTLALKNLVAARWSGGEPVADSVTAAMLEGLKVYGIDDAAATSVVTGQQYWTTRAAEVRAIVDRIVSGTSGSPTSTTLSRVNADVVAYSNAAAFVDVASLRYVDVKLMLDEFGDGADHILSYMPDVCVVDIYQPQDAVLESVNEVAQRHVDNDGLVATSNDYTILTAMRKNRAKLSYFYTLFRYTQLEGKNLPSDEVSGNMIALRAYAPSLYWDESVTLMKGAPDTALASKQNQSTSSFWSDVSAYGSATVQVGDEHISTSLSSVIGAACKDSADFCESMDKFYNETVDLYEDQEERLGAVLEIVTGGSTVWSGLVSLLALINRLLDRAIAMVQAAKAKLTSLFKSVSGGRSLPEALDALANLNLNIYDSFGFQTKFLSCYVSNGASVLLSTVIQKLFEGLNEVISTINDIITELIKATQNALDLLICLADKLSQGFEGSMSYERKGSGLYRAAGIVPVPVTFTMQCVMSFGVDGMDPAVARELMRMKQKLVTLLSLFKLQAITCHKTDDTVKMFKGFEITEATAAGALIEQLRDQVRQKLLSMLSC